MNYVFKRKDQRTFQYRTSSAIDVKLQKLTQEIDRLDLELRMASDEPAKKKVRLALIEALWERRKILEVLKRFQFNKYKKALLELKIAA